MSNQKHLWAPWKMDYLKNKKQDSQKIFSDFIDEDNDKERLILHRAKPVSYTHLTLPTKA